MKRNNLNLDLVKVNAYANFDQIPLIRSQDIERKQNSADNQGHNCVVNLRKWTRDNPNLHLVQVNAYAKFDQIPFIRSQDIERKRNSADNQGS